MAIFKCILWESNFKNLFLRGQFRNVLFEEAIFDNYFFISYSVFIKLFTTSKASLVLVDINISRIIN